MAEDIGLGMDEGDEITDADRVTLVDDEGQEHAFVLLAVVDVEDQDYALLAPEDQLDDDSEGELELFIFQYDVDAEGLEVFSPVDEDDVYEEVRDVFANLMEVEARAMESEA